jgi:DNA replication protein DnaC
MVRRRPATVRDFWVPPNLLAQLHAARATNTFKRKLQQLARIEVLAIDDFGLRPMRSPQDDDFHDLVDARYERKTTLLTSNLDFDEWGAAFPNKLMGAATLASPPT